MNKLKIYEVMQKAMYRFPPATLRLSRTFQLYKQMITIPSHVVSLYL